MHQASFLSTIDFNFKIYKLLVIISLAILSYPTMASANSYLSDIQEEANQTTYLEKAQDEHKKLMRLKASSSNENAPVKKIHTDRKPDELMAEFEDGLYREFPGNFIVYNRLSHEQKMEVISAYQETGNIKGIYRFGDSISMILKLASQ